MVDTMLGPEINYELKEMGNYDETIKKMLGFTATINTVFQPASAGEDSEESKTWGFDEIQKNRYYFLENFEIRVSDITEEKIVGGINWIDKTPNNKNWAVHFGSFELTSDEPEFISEEQKTRENSWQSITLRADFSDISFSEEEEEEDIQTMSANELYRIGSNYDIGLDGKTQDKERAMQYLLKAAEMGNEYAQRRVGLEYYHAGGVLKQNFEKAANWFYEAAKQEYPYECTDVYYYLADIFHNKLEEPHYGAAIYWYERAAVEDDGSMMEYVINSQSALLDIYSDEDSDYFDEEKAQYWRNTYDKIGEVSEEDGYTAEECLKRAAVYLSGSKDNLYWRGKAALADSCSADYKSGYTVEECLNLVDKYSEGENEDPEKVTYWHHKAALAGDIESMLIFAERIGQNEDADEIDRIYARYWLEIAVEAGHKKAKISLALMWKEDNIGWAVSWAERAMENIDEDSPEYDLLSDLIEECGDCIKPLSCKVP